MSESSSTGFGQPAGPSTSTIRQPASPTEEDGEQLPDYSRRDPRISNVQVLFSPPDSLLGVYIDFIRTSKEFSYASKNHKLEICVQGSGTASFPVFVQNLFDVCKGEVTVRLEKPEPITSLKSEYRLSLFARYKSYTQSRKVRLKCVVRTCVYISRANGRHPVTDEIQLFDEGSVL